MKVRKQKGRRGSTATGGSRSRATGAYPEGRRARYDAPPAVLALLRDTWAKRELLSERQREMIGSFLQQAQHGPLTDRQLNAAALIGGGVAVGFDDPRLDDPPETMAKPVPATPKAQPWGPLPLRPPGR